MPHAPKKNKMKKLSRVVHVAFSHPPISNPNAYYQRYGKPTTEELVWATNVFILAPLGASPNSALTLVEDDSNGKTTLLMEFDTIEIAQKLIAYSRFPNPPASTLGVQVEFGLSKRLGLYDIKHNPRKGSYVFDTAFLNYMDDKYCKKHNMVSSQRVQAANLAHHGHQHHEEMLLESSKNSLGSSVGCSSQGSSQSSEEGSLDVPFHVQLQADSHYNYTNNYNNSALVKNYQHIPQPPQINALPFQNITNLNNAQDNFPWHSNPLSQANSKPPSPKVVGLRADEHHLTPSDDLFIKDAPVYDEALKEEYCPSLTSTGSSDALLSLLITCRDQIDKLRQRLQEETHKTERMEQQLRQANSEIDSLKLINAEKEALYNEVSLSLENMGEVVSSGSSTGSDSQSSGMSSREGSPRVTLPSSDHLNELSLSELRKWINISEKLATQARAEERRRNFCQVCLQGFSEVMFIPCQHKASCEACAYRLQNTLNLQCPVCSTQVTDIVKPLSGVSSPLQASTNNNTPMTSPARRLGLSTEN